MNFSILKLLTLSFLITVLSSSFSSSLSSSPPFSQTNISLYNDAFFLNNSLLLTHQSPCSSPPPPPASNLGRAFIANPVRFLGSSFYTKFSFSIISQSSCRFGDGMAFLITSNVESFGVEDGYMAIPELDSEELEESFLAVEFDTSFDPYFGDINDNHVGVDVDKIGSSAVVDLGSEEIDLKNGRELTVWIEYRGEEKVIRIWTGYNSEVKPQSPVLETKIDLRRFREFMHVGFSASNGKGSAIHSVNHWMFKTFKSPEGSKEPVQLDSEGDCLLCKPREMNKSRHSSVSRRFSKRVLVTVGVCGGLSVGISVVVLFGWVWARRRRRGRNSSNESQMLRVQGDGLMKRMSLAEIKEATKEFDRNRIIGESRSAIIYEGELPSCGSVAVKRFCQDSNFGPLLTFPFDTELATMAGCLRHKNLIQLLGWCCEKNELVLVYEFMANGSLDRILHRRTYFTKYLTSERRLHIVLGVASALTYLHEECESQIIHRDVKTCNIMLDEKFNAKLGDFGLAEVYGHDCGTREATVPAGTMGYLAPEYAYSGVPTVKTDVYSFGIVVLEVASGRRPVDEEGTVITEWVWNFWESGQLIEAADSKLMGRFDRVKMERLLRVGLLCAHPDHNKRPPMKEAARILTGESPLPVFPSGKPRVRFQSVLPDSCEEIMRCGGDMDESPPWCTPRSHFSK